ncbi:O-antigen ligase family protein [Scatolibacter rhodanostii]|uniref:O-antigen ligase family protein n=1 Tax=Scatolibacter rhodanostii TaxID=2014781 RepID=UPI000C085C73|nr:O-antigen ligase family protein [Scatolibacter rhodanostii]
MSKAWKWITDSYHYKIVLLVVTFLYVFPFAMGISGQLLKVFLLWGLVVTAVTAFRDRTIHKSKFYLSLFVFLGASLIGVVANYSQNFSRNLIDWFYLIVFLFLFMYVSPDQSKEKIKEELSVLSSVFIFLSFLFSFLSFLIFMTNVEMTYTVDGRDYWIGVFENRLFGIFGNPNTGALISFLSIVASFVILTLSQKNKSLSATKEKSPFEKFTIFNILLQFIVLYLSNSRSVMVALIVFVLVFLFFYGIHYLVHTIQKKRVKVLSMMLILLLGASTVVGSERIIKTGVSYLPAGLAYVQESLNLKSLTNILDPEEKKQFKPVETDREYLTEDVSNGRFVIWTAGFKVASQNIMTGVGNANVLEEVKPHLSKQFLRATPKMASNMHNIYLQILVSGGILPLLAFIGFFLLVILTGFQFLWKKRATKQDFLLPSILFSLLASLMVENLFDSLLVGFMFLFVVFIFWTYLGYFLAWVRQDKEAEPSEEDTVSHQ